MASVRLPFRLRGSGYITRSNGIGLSFSAWTTVFLSWKGKTVV